MKRILVRENINFKRGIGSKKSLDLGDDSTFAKREKFEYVQKKLVKKIQFYGDPRQEDSDRDYVLKYINQYIDILERLRDIGINKNRLQIIGKQIQFRQYQGFMGNSVVAFFFSKGDYDKWEKFIKKYASLNIFPADGTLANRGTLYSLDEMDQALNNRFNNEYS